jgi:hypothetical protein
VSRRRDRSPDKPPQARPERPAPLPPGREPDRLSFAAQVGILVAVFAVTSLIAKLAGAANWGTAFGIGEFFFAIALVLLIVKT